MNTFKNRRRTTRWRQSNTDLQLGRCSGTHTAKNRRIADSHIDLSRLNSAEFGLLRVTIKAVRRRDKRASAVCHLPAAVNLRKPCNVQIIRYRDNT